MLWMQKVFGDGAPAAWEKLAKKTVTVAKGSGEAYGLFRKGESDMALYYTTSPAYQIMKENNDNYAAACLMKATTCKWKSRRVPAPARIPNWRRNSSNFSFPPPSRTSSPLPTGFIPPLT